ncbi:DUF1302 family protein [Piscinibacter sp. XHJ-5]|uniref:DUF1302 domain-containing protein n=1 Tax=Piscinibacter sp. XHJ-5 TaxID=3037797 RepID=UPI002452DE9B|nr:DUF1302 family protein [Piscinibacter sp. XHJ-5]
MTIARSYRGKVPHRGFAVKAVCFAAASALAGPAAALKLGSDNPDLEMVLDTTARYNAAWRTGERDLRLVGSPAVDEGNWLFDKNDQVLSRIDLYSEFDLTWRKDVGLRVSAAAWGDTNFPDKSRSDPRFAAAPNYPNNDFTPYIDRHYKGPSGEFLDAFAWGNVRLGSTSMNVKVGRFAWLPGEFLFSNGGSFTYSMAPNDGRKSDLSPGSSAKETALPIGQLAATWQLNNEFSVMGQYTAEFRSSRISEGGTFWSVGDTALEGPPFISNPAVPRVAPFLGDKGDVALGVKWSPAKLDGDSLGLWVRKFDDKTPTWQNQVRIDGAARSGRAVYAKGIELVGLTYNTGAFGLSTGFELNYRRKMPLNVRSGFAFGTGTGLVDDPGMEGPRGNTIHFLASSVVTLNKNALFDSGSIALQFDAMRLQKITSGASLYNGEGGNTACVDELVLRGCSTRHAASIGANFTATWQQLFPSVDLSVPVFLTYGLKGNAAAVGAGITPEGSWLFRPGVRVEWLVGQYKHQFDLSYTARGGKTGELDNGAGAVNGHGGAALFNASGLANFRDRNYLSFTYQTAF